MALSDIVTITISTASAIIERAGFGVPMILAADCPGGFTERVRFYTSLAGVVADFATTTATYKMAAKVFGQDPKPPRIAVGRLANKPTQSWTITPTVSDSTIYAMTIDGVEYSITSDSSASATEICDALRTAISASGVTEGGTTTLTLTASAAGATHQVWVKDPSRLSLIQDTPDVSGGIATELAAIALEDSTWYAILCPFNSKVIVKAIAAWAESNHKLYLAQTQDSDVVTSSLATDVSAGTTNGSVAYGLKASAYYRTALLYSADNWNFADGAWAGKVLPLDPGSETWMYKTLAGVTASTLTATQRTNVLAKYANCYETIAGVNITETGKVSGNEYIDVIRFRDWLEARLGEEIFAALARSKKVPFTNDGIAMIEGIIRAQLKAGVEVGGLAADPAPKVTSPKASEVSAGDKASRTLTGVKFDAVLAGAIHATTISGTISV